MRKDSSRVPTVLFAFNRPGHTRRVLEGLEKNEIPELHVFVDGPRNRFDEPLVTEVHRLVEGITWTEPVVHARSSNLGLARSILSGVDEILADHSTVIVLEDDCVPHEGFYGYMTAALARYREDDRVGCISGFGPPIERPEESSFDGYFTDRMSSWGWGTWKDAWELRADAWEDIEAELAVHGLDYAKIGRDLGRYGDPRTTSRIGRDIWTPLWLFRLLVEGRQTLWPFESYVRNIGRDGSGMNSGRVGPTPEPTPVSPAGFRFPDPSRETRDEGVTRAFADWFEARGRTPDPGPLGRLRESLAKRRAVSTAYYRIRDAGGLPPRSDPEAEHRLKDLASKTPRFVPGTVQLPFGPLDYVDALSLRYQYREIFLEKRYAFRSTRKRPRILDCGANVGLSSIWFLRTYPGCRLMAFEADPGIAGVLTRNLARYGSDEVDVVSKAVWTEGGTVSFQQIGGDLGRVLRGGESSEAVEVETVRLADVIEKRVDLLKLDVEGAEFAILDDLADSGALTSVDRLICEAHITPDSQEAFVGAQSILDDAGFAFIVRFVRPSEDGPEKEWPTPFVACRDGSYVCLLYAWRPVAATEWS